MDIEITSTEKKIQPNIYGDLKLFLEYVMEGYSFNEAAKKCIKIRNQHHEVSQVSS